MKHRANRTICFLNRLFICFFLLFGFCFCPPAAEFVSASDNTASSDSPFRITVLDVGQGLSVLIEADGHTMIYDGGGRERSSYVAAYLKQHGISDLDYLFASHYDEDHISGLIGVLNTAFVNTAVIPDYESDTAIYQSFVNAASLAGQIEYAQEGDRYPLGKASVDVLYACTGSEDSDNNRSTVLKVTYENISCMLTGDAEFAEENALLQGGRDLGCTVYIVGHHGSSTSSSENFVAAMHPKAALISVGAGNNYGHPAEQTLNTLRAENAEIYRTDTQGELYFESDGASWSVSTEKNTDNSDSDSVQNEDPDSSKTPDNQAGNSGTSSESGAYRYVLNTSSHKFHYPDCGSVKQMAPHNTEYSSKSREELIQEGYSPCGNCRP